MNLNVYLGETLIYFPRTPSLQAWDNLTPAHPGKKTREREGQSWRLERKDSALTILIKGWYVIEQNWRAAAFDMVMALMQAQLNSWRSALDKTRSYSLFLEIAGLCAPGCTHNQAYLGK